MSINLFVVSNAERDSGSPALGQVATPFQVNNPHPSFTVINPLSPASSASEHPQFSLSQKLLCTAQPQI